MKRLAMVTVLVCAGAVPAVAIDLSCGQPESGRLFADGQNESFFFQAAKGDTLLIRLIPISVPSRLPLELYDPSGNRVGDELVGPNDIHVFSGLQAGRYRLTVKSLNIVGAYQLAYVPLNRPCAANTMLSCGKVLKGTLAPGQMQTYTFTGKVGDPISLRLAETAGSDPGASVFLMGFDSASLQQFVSPGQPLSLFTEGALVLPYRLTSDGQQSMVLFERSGRLKLNFSINLVNLKGPCQTITAGCGTSAEGPIADPLATALYSFTAAKGDVYQLRVSTTDNSGGLRTISEVYDPQGNLLDPPTSSDATRFLTLPSSGQYMLLVRDSGLVNSGNYALSLSRLNSPCNAQPLGCGTPVNGQVTGPLRSVVYSVDAQAGDVYLVRLMRTGSNAGFRPKLEIYAPETGAQVQSVTATDQASQTFTAPAAGTYTLLALDALDGNQSGSYTAWIGRLNRPCDVSVGLSCLALAPGSINQPLQAGLYSYSGSAGDAFTVRLLDTAGNLQSAVQVFDPRGVAVPGIPGTSKVVDVPPAPAGGAYTILVTDQNRVPGEGKFVLEAINTKGACGAPVSPGISAKGLISGPAPFAVYTLRASAGDALLLRAAAFTPGFAANMDLYDPAGRRVPAGSGTSAIAPPAVTAGGVYTVLIAASAPRTAGNYTFSWQLLNNPAAGPLQCGQTTSGALGPDNQFWYYLVNANDGDLLKVLLTRLPGTLNAQLELFDPTGARLAVNANEITRKVGAGNYLVVVSPASATAETGGFGLALEKPNHPCGTNSLTCGQTVLRQVTAAGQLDAYPFNGNAGDPISLTVTPRAGAISPVTELYDPSGTAVGAPGTTGLNATLAMTGQYTVTVHDRTGNTGSYRVGLQRSNNACPENDSEKPAITLRRPTGGDVIAGGSVYPIVWQSDDNQAVTSHAVHLSTDGGATFQPVAGANALSGVAQSFSWLVPADIAPTRNAVIQVTATDRAGNTQSASSDLLALIGSGFAANSSATYEYDALNRLSKVTYQDGRVIQYAYDAAGNLTAITVQ
jgi:YD repeat-containing protein